MRRKSLAVKWLYAAGVNQKRQIPRRRCPMCKRRSLRGYVRSAQNFYYYCLSCNYEYGMFMHGQRGCTVGPEFTTCSEQELRGLKTKPGGSRGRGR